VSHCQQLNQLKVTLKLASIKRLFQARSRHKNGPATANWWRNCAISTRDSPYRSGRNLRDLQGIGSPLCLRQFQPTTSPSPSAGSTSARKRLVSLPGLLEASSDERWLTLHRMFRHYSSSEDRDSWNASSRFLLPLSFWARPRWPQTAPLKPGTCARWRRVCERSCLQRARTTSDQHLSGPELGAVLPAARLSLQPDPDLRSGAANHHQCDFGALLIRGKSS